MKFAIKFFTTTCCIFVFSCSSPETLEKPPPGNELLQSIYEAKGQEKWNDVYKLCKKYVYNYPSDEKVEEIKKIQYEACRQFVKEGEKKQFLFIPYTVRSRPIDNFLNTIRSYPYETYTDEYIYWFGDFMAKKGYTTTAEIQFQKILDRYSESQYADDSLYKLGVIYFNRFNGVEYSEDALKEADLYFSRIMDEFPDSEYISDASKHLQIIHGLLAEKLFAAAEFYESREIPKGAIAYYREILFKYPETKTAEKSRKALTRLTD